jgi:hypothetical protein
LATHCRQSIFFAKFHTVAKSENELRPSQSVLFVKIFKNLARKVEEKEKEKKAEFTTFRLCGPTGS